jgi:Ca-activated chloride channel family protein
MQFGNYAAAVFFWVIFGIGVFYFWAFRQKARVIEQFVQKSLLTTIADSYSFKKSCVKAGILLVAGALCVAALMRPQWGYKLEQVKRRGVDIFIAVDV